MIQLHEVYDANKKGTLVIGLPRSGTHHLASIIKNFLEQNGILTSDHKELLLSDQDFSQAMANDFKNIDMKYKTNEYSVFSSPQLIVPVVLGEYLKNNFHIVRIIRKNVLAHVMSLAIFNVLREHNKNNESIVNSVVVQDSFREIFKNNIPYTLPVDRLFAFISNWNTANNYNIAQKIFYYEDIENFFSDAGKSRIPYSPEEFFKNYNEIKSAFIKAGLMNG